MTVTETPEPAVVRSDEHLQRIVARANAAELHGAAVRKGHRTRRAGVLLDSAENRLRIFRLNPGRADEQLVRARQDLQEATTLLSQAAPGSKAAQRHQARLVELRAEADRLEATPTEQLRVEHDERVRESRANYRS